MKRPLCGRRAGLCYLLAGRRAVAEVKVTSPIHPGRQGGPSSVTAQQRTGRSESPAAAGPVHVSRSVTLRFDGWPG